MRVLNRTLSLISLLGLAFAASACGQDFVGKIACTDTASCVAKAKALFPDGVDGGDKMLPVCCSNFCVLPSGGCLATGYRYLDNDPGYGQCVAEDPMCPALPDMSQPEQPGDMSSSD